MKKFLSVLMTLVIIFSLALPAKTAEAAVKISKEKATMEVDSTLKLKISGSGSKVTWKTSKNTVASVSSTGIVTAKKEGNATITATVSGSRYTCDVTVVNSNKSTTRKETKVYNLGDTWTVDGLWSVTFNSVTSTNDRNEYSDKKPDQVITLNYTYKNIGYKDDGLYLSSVNMKVLDEKGEIADTYPGDVTTYPQATPIGAKCVGAQEVFGLNNVSKTITVYVELYDNDYNKHTATFKLKVD